MIPLAARASRVLLDTSVLVNFAKGGALLYLAKYLGERAARALDVEVEVRRLAASRFPELATLARMSWPPGPAIELPPQLLLDAADLQRIHKSPGGGTRENRGEIATALLAAHLRDALVLMDDQLGKQLSRFRGVPHLSSSQLVAEMHAAESIDEEAALVVFDRATPSNVGVSRFHELVGRARAALAD